MNVSRRLWVGMLLLVSLLFYGRTVTYPFVSWDDPMHLYENPLLTPSTIGGVGQFWMTPYRGLYIPVTYTAWSLLSAVAFDPTQDSALERLKPALFHTVNIAFHAFNGILVFFLLILLLTLAQ